MGLRISRISNAIGAGVSLYVGFGDLQGGLSGHGSMRQGAGLGQAPNSRAAGGTVRPPLCPRGLATEAKNGSLPD